jgi:L-2,4-diaminobutyric acid acetyltransferase
MPQALDGPRVSALVKECPPLDANSAYCNLLQCTHFADSCMVAERQDRLVGWMSGYRLPSAPEQFFVWQVAIHSSSRGAGLASRMLAEMLDRAAMAGVDTLLATITERNTASWQLFSAFARRLGVEMTRRPMFDGQAHFADLHETEHLVSIALPPRHQPSRSSQTQNEEL